jgi:glycosyltransferase involved in cell wall biosynthesis
VIYIFLPTNNVGGVENRFVEMWVSMQIYYTRKPKLVMSQTLYNLYQNTIYKSSISKYLENVIFYEAPITNYNKFNIEVLKILRRDKPRLVHFVYLFPIKTIFFPVKKIYTFPTSSIRFAGRNDKISLLSTFILSVFNKCTIDVLDLEIFSLLQTYSRNIFNTPGSIINMENYSNPQHIKNTNNIVFLGRFVSIKQIDKFVRLIPEIISYLNNRNTEISISILGKGLLEENIRESIKGFSKEIQNTIEIKYSDDPRNCLYKSKVILSLQKQTNYPSKSLLEGIAAGCIPLVTNVGSTNKIANKEFSYYVEEDFTAQEIGEQLFSILNLKEEAFNKKSTIAKSYVSNRFNISNSLNYFEKLYKKHYV